MAKSTRSGGKKEAPGGRVAVMEMPNPAAEPEPQTENENLEAQEPETQEPDAQEPEAHAGPPEIRRERAPFFLRLTQYESSLWENELLLYVYRLAPITDRSASGQQVRNIAKLQHPIDEDYVMREPNWGGSGRYRVMLNRRKPNSNQTTCIDKVDFEIENLEYPPKVPPSEWTKDPRNERWAWARPKEAPGATAPPPQEKPGLSIQDAFAIFNQAKEWAASSKEQALSGTNVVELIKTTQNANNPQQIIDAAAKLLEITRPAAPPPPPPPPPDPVQQLKTLTEAIQVLIPKPVAPPPPPDPLEQVKAFAEVAKALAPPPPPAPPDPITQIKATLELTKSLREETEAGEGGRSSKMSGWQEMLQPFLEKVGAPLVGLVTVLVQKTMSTPQPQPGITRPVVTVDANAQPQPGAQPQNGGGETLTPEQQQNQALLAGIFEFMTPQMAHHLENGWSGAEFAAWVNDARIKIQGIPIPIPGSTILSKAKEIGRDTLIEVYKANPPFWTQVQQHESKLPEFLDQFLAWDPNAEENEDETPPPAKPTKSGRKGAAQ